MNFKPGQKVVCIKYDPVNKTDGRLYPAPKKGEIVTIEQIDHRGYFYLVEYQEKFKAPWGTMERIIYDSATFRPLDYDFVQSVIEQIRHEQQIKIITK